MLKSNTSKKQHDKKQHDKKQQLKKQHAKKHRQKSNSTIWTEFTKTVKQDMSTSILGTLG